MTEKVLLKYRSLVARVERNGSKILELQSKEIPVVSGKVKGYSKHFPYIETRMSVQMEEPKKADEDQ